jgi:hypothetical protein
MKNRKKKHNGITLDYGVINTYDFIDVEVLVSLPTKEQYLAVISKEVGNHAIGEPIYRYAPTSDHDFENEEATPPLEVFNALDSVIKDVVLMIYNAEKGAA